MTEESIRGGLRSLLLNTTVRYKDCVYAWYLSMYVCIVQCVLIDKYIVRKFYLSLFRFKTDASLQFFTKPSY